MKIYLDHAASTPIDPLVAEVMGEALADPALQANPASRHGPGQLARERIEAARAEVAALIGASAAEIIWTSGATESNNLAILGAACFRAGRGRHLLSSPAEHPSVVRSCRHLERQGFSVTWLATDTRGLIDPQSVADALREDTTLVSLMLVNNETGVMQDIAAIGAICRARDVLLHVDAVQAPGRESIDVRALGADLLSLSAHKMHGPKGIGTLFIDRQRLRRVEPIMFGGDQERGLRPGTVATHQVIGMGVAARLALERWSTDREYLLGLREQLWEAIRPIPGLLLNGHPQQRACHILNVSVAGVEAESLQLALRDLAVSSGSACHAESAEPSAVLRGLGRTGELARSSLRFSLARTNTVAEMLAAAQALEHAARQLRRLAPDRGG